jgi:hypothetical protein
MNASLKQVLLISVVAVLVVVAWGQFGPAQDEPKKAVQQREYYSISNPAKEDMKTIGNEGWDLVAVESTHADRQVTYYFQRLK